MEAASPYVGVGLYTIGDAARLLKVSQSTLRYWVGELKSAAPIVQRRFAAEHLLSFAELMELHFVKLFRDQQVSFQAIRVAAREAARKFKTDYPFTVQRFDTDGRQIFATLERQQTEEELIEELHHGQLVFKFIRPFFRKLDYRSTDVVERFWPLRRTGRVVLDPLRRFGQPIDAPTGVPTRAIFDAVNAGDGQEVPKVARWFDIPPEAVKAAIRFEKSLTT